MAHDISANSVIEQAKGSRQLSVGIGCRPSKKAGAIGLDIVTMPGVDHVLDVTRELFSFDDGSVCDVFSSHCGWNDAAFLSNHERSWNERWWLHYRYYHTDQWQPVLGARWRLKELRFSAPRTTVMDLRLNGISVGFALRHMKSVSPEIGPIMEIDEHPPAPAPGDPLGPAPTWHYLHGRDGAPHSVEERRIDRCSARDSGCVRCCGDLLPLVRN